MTAKLLPTALLLTFLFDILFLIGCSQQSILPTDLPEYQHQSIQSEQLALPNEDTPDRKVDKKITNTTKLQIIPRPTTATTTTTTITATTATTATTAKNYTTVNQKNINSDTNTSCQKDLWSRLRNGFVFQEHYDNAAIEKQVTWYKNSQSYIDLIVQRGQPFLYYIIEQLEANNMPLELALLPAVESAYDPLAYSHSHASGLWQFMPATGKYFGLQHDWWYDGRRDPVASTEAAIQYLKYLNKYFDGNWLLALAAYNSGEGNVRKAINHNQEEGKPTDFWSLNLPRETRAYVPQLLAISRIIAAPEQHGITLPTIINKPYFTTVQIPEQIDLSKAAEMAGIEANQFQRLNAGYNHWVTHPVGPQQLLLPVDKVKNFKKVLVTTSPKEWTPIQQYLVKSGDTLSAISQRYRVTEETLRNKNDLRSDFLRIGQHLKIPGTGFDRPYTEAMNIYTVKNGDSLWSIAKKQEVSVHNIAKWNNLDIRSILQLGQKLKIYIEGKNSSPPKLKG